MGPALNWPSFKWALIGMRPHLKKNCTLIPENAQMMRTAAPEAARRRLQRKLLGESPDLQALYQRLGVPVLTPAALLASLLLPRFDAVPAAVQRQLLQYVVEGWGGLKDDGELLAALKTTPFVDTGTLVYGPRHASSHNTGAIT